MIFEIVKSYIKKKALHWYLPRVLENLKVLPFPSADPVFGAPEFNLPLPPHLMSLHIKIQGLTIPVLTTIKEKIFTIRFSSIDGVTSSRQREQIFSKMFLPKEYPPLQSVADAEKLLATVYERHKNTEGLSLVKEQWSKRIWIDNMDGSHRLAALSVADSRLNLNLCLRDIPMTTYDFNEKIKELSFDQFRFILPAVTAYALRKIPNIDKFVKLYELANAWGGNQDLNMF